MAVLVDEVKVNYCTGIGRGILADFSDNEGFTFHKKMTALLSSNPSSGKYQGK